MTLREQFEKEKKEKIVLDYNSLPFKEINRKYVLWLEKKVKELMEDIQFLHEEKAGIDI